MKLYLEELNEKGHLNSFSEKHFIKRALNGDCTYFDKICSYSNPLMHNKVGLDTAKSFLMNFSARLMVMKDSFGEDAVLEFINDQLSAGKKNYSEAQFFRAYSEVVVLAYFFMLYSKNIIVREYEPKLGNGKKNPEARLGFKNGVTIDIEVKTPGFPKPKSVGENKNGILKPNVILTDYQLRKLEKYCKKNDFSLQRPRVGKLKDFIKSACEKFVEPVDDKHFNILFINWTYNDYPELMLEEPLNLLINDMSGILNNDKVLEMLDIDLDEMKKLSAIVLYKDNFENIITADFRHHFIDQSVKLVCNRKYNPLCDYDLLCKTLKINPYNLTGQIEMFPVDYIKKDECDDDVIKRAADYFDHIIYADANLLSGIYDDVDAFRSMRKGLIIKTDFSKKDRFI